MFKQFDEKLINFVHRIEIKMLYFTLPTTIGNNNTEFEMKRDYSSAHERNNNICSKLKDYYSTFLLSNQNSYSYTWCDSVIIQNEHKMIHA